LPAGFAVTTELTLQTLAFVALGAFVGSLASGGLGFAFGTVGAAFWLHVLEPVHATMLVVIGGTIVQVGTFWPLRRSMEWNRLWPFIVAGLVGIPIGVWLLVRTDATVLKVALGAFIGIYGGYALAAPRLPRFDGGGKVADAAIGLIGGVLGGVGGYSGLVPAMWTQLRRWPKDVSRAVYQPFVLMAHAVTVMLVGVVALDRLGRVFLICLLVAVPALLAGGWIGWKIYGRLDERRFQQALAAMLVVSGVILVLT
jgi:uncharacterized membrane protein YfcA